eukprot:gene16797-23075_t
MSMKLVNNSVARRGVSCKAASGKGMDPRSYLKTLPGITSPFPDVFDPLSLADSASVPTIRRWRESELIHSRVAMLAAVGFLVGEKVEDVDAFTLFEGKITGPAINQFQQIKQGFWEPLLITIGLAEAYRVALGWATPNAAAGEESFNELKDEYEMGNLSLDPLGLAPTNAAELLEMQTKELNNGRLAMIAVAGFTAQELVDKKGIFEHINAV